MAVYTVHAPLAPDLRDEAEKFVFVRDGLETGVPIAARFLRPLDQQPFGTHLKLDLTGYTALFEQDFRDPNALRVSDLYDVRLHRLTS